ncbi:hypothetical protein F5884DRAFT_887329 [Xylogone sp. PMI_703]|nr:hypothetical protein F5884DRAFT_887329 [Xylogone sp. PMI_703]
MSLIYASGNPVICWLGDSSPETDLMFSWTERYAGKKFTWGSLYWYHLATQTRFSTGVRRKRELSIATAQGGIYTLLHAPYWTRMWTQQEFRLPKDEPTCICGDRTFKVSFLNYQVGKLLHEADKIRIKYETVEQVPDKEAEMYGFKIRQRFEDNLKKRRENFVTFQPGELRSYTHRKSNSTLIKLLADTALNQCTDPRDKVYALYGIVKRVERAYPPDYTKSVERVMLEATAYIINYEKYIDIPTAFALRPERLENYSIPSWVPNFALPSYLINPSDIVKSMLDKTLWTEDEPLKSTVIGDLSSLHLWACPLGRCTVLFRFPANRRGIIARLIAVLTMSNEYITQHDLWRKVLDA